MKPIYQINTLRGIGVLIVIVFHWIFRGESDILSHTPTFIDFFFVVSGFFITNILLDGRRNAELEGKSKSGFLKLFFLGRTIRIFPIYYLTIFFLLVFHRSSETGIKENFLYFFTYTSNYYFHAKQEWDGIITPLWSLAVEEQFYLLWPWVILLSKQKHLPYIIGLFLVSGLAADFFWAKTEFDIIMTVNCMDAFGVGALLSWIYLNRPQYLLKIFRAFSVLTVFCLAFFFGSSVQKGFFQLPDLSIIIFSAWLITYTLLNELKVKLKISALLNPILNNKQLMFIGKLSYGIYLYHTLVPHYTSKLAKRFHLSELIPSIPEAYVRTLAFTADFILLLFISWLSYKYIEKPILGLRRYYEPRKKEPVIVKEKSFAA